MDAEAFSPGHVTGFFEIRYTEDLLSSGSRGAGLCLALGAKSTVRARKSGRTSIEVTIDGRRSQAAVTRAALLHLLQHEMYQVEVTTQLDLPQSQGFGMSAAGALSASLALAEILGRGRHEAFEAAHMAEVSQRTGLGDVSAIHKAGITIRTRPGL